MTDTFEDNPIPSIRPSSTAVFSRLFVAIIVLALLSLSLSLFSACSNNSRAARLSGTYTGVLEVDSEVIGVSMSFYTLNGSNGITIKYTEENSDGTSVYLDTMVGTYIIVDDRIQIILDDGYEMSFTFRKINNSTVLIDGVLLKKQ